MGSSEPLPKVRGQYRDRIAIRRIGRFQRGRARSIRVPNAVQPQIGEPAGAGNRPVGERRG
jgi:hypothetical protein